MQVDYQNTYLLRIINAAMNEVNFFGITNHSLTVVAQDASYVQRFTNDYVLISPGQTMDVLISANQNTGQYYMATRPFHDSSAPSRDNITTGVIQYKNSDGGLNASLIMLPASNDSDAAIGFISRIRNSNVTQNPRMKIPKDIDRRVYIAIATHTLNCDNCTTGSRFAASLNNVSFAFPRIDILQAYYNRYMHNLVYLFYFLKSYFHLTQPTKFPIPLIRKVISLLKLIIAIIFPMTVVSMILFSQQTFPLSHLCSITSPET